MSDKKDTPPDDGESEGASNPEKNKGADFLAKLRANGDNIVAELNTNNIQPKPIKSVESYRIRSSDIVFDQPLLKQGAVTLMSRKNMSVVKAKPKAGKTFYTSILAASFLGNTQFGISNTMVNGIVLIIDTEQADEDTIHCLKRTEKLAELESTNNNIIVLLINEMDAIEMQKFIQMAIEFYKPDLVIIDGLADLCTNFNDLEQSTLLVTYIRQLATKHNCHILTVLHEGKGSGELLGHLGAVALRKSQAVYQLIKEGDIVTVSPNAMRRKPFFEFSFMIDEHGMPVYCGEVVKVVKLGNKKPKATEIPISTHEQIISKVFANKPQIKYSEFVSLLKLEFEKTGNVVGDNRAKDFITYYQSEELIKKHDNGKNSYYYLEV